MAESHTQPIAKALVRARYAPCRTPIALATQVRTGMDTRSIRVTYMVAMPCLQSLACGTKLCKQRFSCFSGRHYGTGVFR